MKKSALVIMLFSIPVCAMQSRPENPIKNELLHAKELLLDSGSWGDLGAVDELINSFGYKEYTVEYVRALKGFISEILNSESLVESTCEAEVRNHLNRALDLADEEIAILLKKEKGVAHAHEYALRNRKKKKHKRMIDQTLQERAPHQLRQSYIPVDTKKKIRKRIKKNI